MSNYEEDVRDTYSRMGSDELIERFSSGALTDVAKSVALAELKFRGIDPNDAASVMNYKMRGESSGCKELPERQTVSRGSHIKRLLFLIFLITAIPIGGYLAGTYSHSQLLKSASIGVLLVGLGLLLAIFLSALLASSSRSLLLNIFSPGINIVLLCLFVLIIVQGAIATYGVYIFEVTTIHRFHPFLIGGIGLGALLGALAMIDAGFSVSRRASTSAIGKVISEAAEPELWKFVREIAARLGATPPNNIVIGLEPTFYVTSADVVVYPGANKQPNETLYLSLPLMRILSHNELTAVIGHELGHFRGEDTKFSLRFYPIYAGTGQALAALQNQNQGGVRSLALLPAIAILSFFMEQFAKAERTIGRDRELEADKAGSSVSSGKALATSLLKIGAFSPLWDSIRSAMVEALSQGKSYSNISMLYAEVAASSSKPELLDEVAATSTAHPTDTHPPTGARLQALGLSVAELREEALNIDAKSSSANLLTNPTEVEEYLTGVEHHIMLELGYAKLPAEMQHKREGILRQEQEHEQEQRERERERAKTDIERVKSESSELLLKRIKIAEPVGLDDVKNLAASVESSDFINWCCWGHIEKVKIAVEKNPLFLAISTSNGNTALHWAVITKQQEIVKFLANKNADVNVPNNEGKSPIDIAKSSGQAELVDMLQKFSEE